MEPRVHDVFRFREQREAGSFEGDFDAVWTILNKLMKKYRANRYDMLTFNCNHFSDEFLRCLTGKGLPADLNRAANVGAYAHCVVPRRYLIVTPPQDPKVAEWDVATSDKSLKSSSADSNDVTEDDTLIDKVAAKA